jgi:N-acylneuraminate cytidylyltransferase
MLILSKEKNPVVAARATKLGVEVIQGIDDKEPVLRNWCQEHSIALDRVAYVGNDINDAACLRAVGWPVLVARSHSSVNELGRVHLQNSGGHGALRELADMIAASRKEES